MQIKKLLEKAWFWIASLVLLILFLFWIDKKLIFGGILLVLIGLKQYIIPGIRNKSPINILIGLLIFFEGYIAIFTKALLIEGIDAFVFFVLLIVLLFLFIYSILEGFLVKAKLIAIPTLIFFAVVLSYSIDPLMGSIQNEGFSSGYFYFASLIFILLINFTYFILIKNILSLMNIQKIEYLSLALAISLFVLIAGYFYLKNISDNSLRDFLLILSILFITVWGGTSSLKEFLSKSVEQ